MSDARTGLYGGKFAPFHRGHQFVTELALKEVDHLIIIVYSCNVIDIPVNVRANWIRKLYPEVNVIEAWSTPEGDPNDPKNKQVHIDYIKKLIGTHKITHFYSSERYGEYVSKALSCIDRRVDMSRTNVPICATKIRENVFEFREYLSPVVYRDFITKVAFIGSMLCGKTTITEVLGRKHHTTWALEFGREYWNQHQVDRQLPPEGFDEICRGQIALEDAALINANKYFFGGTCAITAYMFTLEFNGIATDYLKQMALENPQRYDLYFVCGDKEEEMVTVTDVIVEYDEHYSLVTLTDTERDSVQSAKEKAASESSSESIQSLRTEKKKEEEVEDKKKEKEDEDKKEDNDSYEYYSSDDQKDDKKDDQKDDQNDDKKDDKVSDSETSYSYTETEVLQSRSQSLSRRTVIAHTTTRTKSRRRAHRRLKRRRRKRIRSKSLRVSTTLARSRRVSHRSHRQSHRSLWGVRRPHRALRRAPTSLTRMSITPTIRDLLLPRPSLRKETLSL